MNILVGSVRAVVVLCFLLVASRALADGSELPSWAAAGSDIADGWKVVGVESHQEFVRLKAGRGKDIFGAEIRFRRPDEAAGSPWATAHYIVQPAPGAASSEEFLKIVLARLKDAESAGAPLFVGAAPRVEARQEHGTATWYLVPSHDFNWRMILSPPGIAALAALALFLLLFAVPGAPRRAGSRIAGRVVRVIGVMFAVLLRLLHLIDPLPDGHRPANGGRFSLWWDVVATAAVGLLAWLFLRAFLPADMAVQIDQSSDLVYARHFADLHMWPRVGPMSSFGRLMQGNHIYLVWKAFLASGTDIKLAYPMMIASNALAAALVFLGFRRVAGIVAAFVAAALFTFLNLCTSGLSFVWIPSLLPLFVVVFFVVATWFVRRPTWQAALLSGMALALAVNVHIMTLLLLPVLALACGMAGGRRAGGFAIVALTGLVGVMTALAPDSCIVNFSILVGSGWLLPGVVGTFAMVAAGAAMHFRFTPADNGVRGASFMYVATILTVVILFGLSAASGRPLGFRYAFPAVLGVAFIGGQVFSRYLNLVFTVRPRFVRPILAAAAILLAMRVFAGEPVEKLERFLALVTPTMDATARLADKLAARGLTAWDMKWAIQTQENTAFIRTIQMFPPAGAAAGPRWNGETSWQVMRLRGRPSPGPLPEGFSWIRSTDGSGLLVEELRPWVRRDRVEICFENIDPPSGVPGCADASSVTPPRPGELRFVNIVTDERIGPLQLVARQAWEKFQRNPGSRVRMSYRVPLQPAGPDAEREIVLVGGDFRTFDDIPVGRPGMDEGWRVAAARGVNAETDRSGQRAVVKHIPGATGVDGLLVLERDIGTPESPALEVPPPTWFEIRPSGRPIWHAPR